MVAAAAAKAKGKQDELACNNQKVEEGMVQSQLQQDHFECADS
jgi:hypothetical protein